MTQMNPKNKFWLFAGVSIALTFVIITSIFILFWQELTPEEKIVSLKIFKQHFGYIFSVAFLLLAGLGFALDAMVHNYVIPVSKMAEETVLINTVNLKHRIHIEGSKDCIRLAQVINESAERYQELQNNVQQKIQVAKAEAEDEKNILAAFMTELPEGVLVCNAEGRILLYNRQAKEFFGCEVRNMDCEIEEDKASELQFIGLGRSVFGVIDKNLIVHALDEIAEKLERDESHVASYFVVASGAKLLHTEAVPVLNQNRQLTGFILIFYDITAEIESDNRMGGLLQSFTTGIRASLASIRAPIEAILEYPNMENAQLQKFHEIINVESITLSDFLNKTARDYAAEIKTHWPLVQMTDKDLVEMIRRKAREKLSITLKVETAGEENQVRVDTYSVGLAMLFILDRLRNLTGTRRFDLRIERKDRFMNLDLLWKGSPIKIETLREWDAQMLIVEEEGLPLTLKEVIRHHEAEIWSHSCKESEGKSYLRLFKRSADQSYLRVLLPVVETSEPDSIRNLMVVSESRPEFYDFDLFNQPGQTLELDNRPLSELSYTVFDTETTGLNPQGGDEIISIGAMRIVNSHLLQEEIFDQLIDPGCHLPLESITIHGIQPEMLRGKPTIDNILPLFHRFAEDTVLVAHNAAFDMRMLEMKEAQTGIRFINPVLDTLLLSAVIHPAQENHNMELIAKRLGISIVGRHTALGDAIATGEIFLKLVSLLEKSGIHTLKEARTASQKTYYARLKY
ncbi:MAG: hypothetical protein B6245_00230 [Desulfobacteraceae bacterium 4572_88]|nr:MAG: hypothetical protein B6245_00230 [Desulfobacteraceae bacterium 4572_88]